MRGRTAALAIAGVLLLGGMIALRCSLMSSPETEPAPAATPVAAAPSAPAPTVAPSSPSAPAPTPTAPAAPVPAGPAATAAPGAPELPAVVEAFTPSEKRPPIANKALLRQQVAAVAGQVADCAKQAEGSGANGTAVLTYMVTPDKKKQQVEIEQTGIEYDGTTIDNQPLLDCLKDTSKAMTFTYVPDTDGVFALRRVKLADGKVVENAFVNFHYVR